MRAASLSKIGQVQTKAPVVIPAARGTIFDSMGAPLALGEQATTVYVDPHEVRNPAHEAQVAARVARAEGRSTSTARSTSEGHALLLRRAQGAIR